MRLGTDIRYARNEAIPDGGRRIVIITPRIVFDKKDNKVEIENYGVEPVRLRQLRLEVRK